MLLGAAGISVKKVQKWYMGVDKISKYEFSVELNYLPQVSQEYFLI